MLLGLQVEDPVWKTVLTLTGGCGCWANMVGYCGWSACWFLGDIVYGTFPALLPICGYVLR